MSNKHKKETMKAILFNRMKNHLRSNLLKNKKNQTLLKLLMRKLQRVTPLNLLARIKGDRIEKGLNIKRDMIIIMYLVKNIIITTITTTIRITMLITLLLAIKPHLHRMNNSNSKIQMTKNNTSLVSIRIATIRAITIILIIINRSIIIKIITIIATVLSGEMAILKNGML